MMNNQFEAFIWCFVILWPILALFKIEINGTSLIFVNPCLFTKILENLSIWIYGQSLFICCFSYFHSTCNSLNISFDYSLLDFSQILSLPGESLLLLMDFCGSRLRNVTFSQSVQCLTCNWNTYHFNTWSVSIFICHFWHNLPVWRPSKFHFWNFFKPFCLQKIFFSKSSWISRNLPQNMK